MEHKSKIFKALTTRIMKDNFQDKQLIEQLADMLKEIIDADQPKAQIHLLYYELTNLSSNFDLMNERLYYKYKEEININPKIIKIKQYLLMDATNEDKQTYNQFVSEQKHQLSQYSKIVNLLDQLLALV
ncbi:MAG: hypothetical protein EZS28_032387 [Streblomastix strix]|uniref:Uncharacterized protein n=1 Tax=Streblomastix strix TaxID=222440 RepID=A0A5J4UN11_9EUKA|nr:MAG: hypothetical protein EZS28_032387 [Streblomastix strix]